MNTTATDCERRIRIGRAIDFIQSNLSRPVSLPELAKEASYSPWHFGKIFQAVTGESPKQYMLSRRLEAALHWAVIHPQMPVQEVAAEFGFSSPAVFCRAIKKHFGYAPDGFRALPPDEKISLFSRSNPSFHPPHVQGLGAIFTTEAAISYLPLVQGIYVLAAQDDAEHIRAAFERLCAFALAHGVSLSSAQCFGISQVYTGGWYKAFAALSVPGRLPSGFAKGEIGGGRYAAFSLRGPRHTAHAAARNVVHRWIEGSGYALAHAAGFEVFALHPAITPYHELPRTGYLPLASGQL